MRQLSVDEVAGILRVRKRAVYRLILDGELAAVREGDLSVLIPEDVLNNYLRGAVVAKEELRRLAEKLPVRAISAPRCPGRVSACPELRSDQRISI